MNDLLVVSTMARGWRSFACFLMSIHVWGKALCAEMNLTFKYHSLFSTCSLEVLLVCYHSSDTPLSRAYARPRKSDVLGYSINDLFQSNY
jgi:hypothetical protein